MVTKGFGCRDFGFWSGSGHRGAHDRRTSSRFDEKWRHHLVAGKERMAIEEVVRKVLLEDHADVVRESVRWVA